MKKIGKYEIYDTLTSGRFHKIKRAINSETREEVAIKIIDKIRLHDIGLLDSLKTEIAIQKMMNHCNILCITDMFGSNSKVFLVTEVMNCRRLQDLLHHELKLKESASRYFFRQIINGVDHCHSQNVTLGNLQLSNILLNNSGVIKISDFSCAQPDLFGTLTHDSMKLDGHYFSPESVTCSGNTVDRSKTDIWHCGIILYTLAAGSWPFEEENNVLSMHLRNKHMCIDENQIFPVWFSEDLKDICQRLLEVEPINRYSVQEVQDHKWYQQSHIMNDFADYYDYATLSPIGISASGSSEGGDFLFNETGIPSLMSCAGRASGPESGLVATNSSPQSTPSLFEGFQLFSFLCNPFTAFAAPQRKHIHSWDQDYSSSNSSERPSSSMSFKTPNKAHGKSRPRRKKGASSSGSSSSSSCSSSSPQSSPRSQQFATSPSSSPLAGAHAPCGDNEDDDDNDSSAGAEDCDDHCASEGDQHDEQEKHCTNSSNIPKDRNFSRNATTTTTTRGCDDDDVDDYDDYNNTTSSRDRDRDKDRDCSNWHDEAPGQAEDSTPIRQACAFDSVKKKEKEEEDAGRHGGTGPVTAARTLSCVTRYSYDIDDDMTVLDD